MQVTLHFLLATYALLGASPDLRPRADLDIREVRSVRVGEHVYRALLGYSEVYPFLVVEQVRLPLTEGDEPALVASWKLRDMEGGTAIRLQEGDDIKDLKWNNANVEFELARSDRRSRCVVANVVAGKPKVSCKNA
jgi:hypothetical protein